MNEEIKPTEKKKRMIKLEDLTPKKNVKGGSAPVKRIFGSFATENKKKGF